jgi:hypothetical protein
MKAKHFILTNWMLSLVGLSVDTEATPLWGVMLMFAWFIISSILLIHADRKGLMSKGGKQ